MMQRCVVDMQGGLMPARGDAGTDMPTQFQCFDLVLREVQELEIREAKEVFYLPDSISCQRQKAGGEGQDESGSAGRREPGSWVTSGAQDTLGVKEAGLGLLNPLAPLPAKEPGLERYEAVLWGAAKLCQLLPCLSPSFTYRREGTQARFSIRWILFYGKRR